MNKKEILFVNKYTGQKDRYKSVANVVESAGMVNDQPDLCRKEDYVPVRDIIARFTRSGLTLQDLARETEAQYLHSDGDGLSIDDDTLEDNVDIASNDILDRSMDLEEYIATLPNQQVSDSAAGGAGEGGTTTPTPAQGEGGATTEPAEAGEA